MVMVMMMKVVMLMVMLYVCDNLQRCMDSSTNVSVAEFCLASHYIHSYFFIFIVATVRFYVLFLCFLNLYLFFCNF